MLGYVNTVVQLNPFVAQLPNFFKVVYSTKTGQGFVTDPLKALANATNASQTGFENMRLDKQVLGL